MCSLAGVRWVTLAESVSCEGDDLASGDLLGRQTGDHPPRRQGGVEVDDLRRDDLRGRRESDAAPPKGDGDGRSLCFLHLEHQAPGEEVLGLRGDGRGLLHEPGGRHDLVRGLRGDGRGDGDEKKEVQNREKNDCFHAILPEMSLMTHRGSRPDRTDAGFGKKADRHTSFQN